MPERTVFTFLVSDSPGGTAVDPMCVGLESLRCTSRGGWVLVERGLETVFLPTLRTLGGDAYTKWVAVRGGGNDPATATAVNIFDPPWHTGGQPPLAQLPAPRRA